MKHGIQNSRIEIYLGVFRNLLEDIRVTIEGREAFRGSTPYNLERETARDYAYIESRVRSEGLPFLTISLPRLGKWYDSVAAGQTGALVVGFKPYHRAKSDAPAFACPVFCRTLYAILRNDTIPPLDKARVFRAYRSLFYCLYKLEEPFTDEQLVEAQSKWLSNEEELANLALPDFFDTDLTVARDIIAETLNDQVDIFTNIQPRHGPGAVANGEDNEGKWEHHAHIPSLHSVYPWYDYFGMLRSSGRVPPEVAEILLRQRSLPKVEAVSRLLFVPKDSRGPRTISCEPKELQYYQQGIARNLMRLLEASTRGRINFVDQTVNANIALASSASGDFATIDLQDASDRVSLALVLTLFPTWTHRYLIATRSHSTKLPDGMVKSHLKYAPMGSALCFPVESLVFWALACAASIRSLGGYTPIRAEVAKRDTYAYGDDLIIRPEVFDYLVEVFTKVGLKVNASKSFVSGPFRESCGMDALNGHCVTPVRIKKDLCPRSLGGPLASAWCELSTRYFAIDMRNTGEYIYKLITSRLPGVIRTNEAGLGCLNVVDPLAFEPVYLQCESGWDRRACRIWLRTWCLVSTKQPTRLDGSPRLLKNLLGNWELHDPAAVVARIPTKIRKRKVYVA